MTQKIFPYIVSIGFGLVAIVAVVYLFSIIFKNCNKQDNEALIIHDTTTVERYHTEVKHDTVIKWYEKIIWKEAKPTVIYIQKVDSVFLEMIKNYDVMLKVDKRGRKLKIFAVNQNDSVLKEMYFDVGSNFTATSAHDKVFVKTQRWYWNRITLLGGWNTSLTDFKAGYWEIGARTGINYMERAGLEGGLYYNRGKGFETRINLNITLP